MPAIFDELRFHAYMPTSTTLTPFSAWGGSKLQNYEVSYDIITLGQTLDVAKRIANDSIHALPLANRLHILAHSIAKVNGKELVSDEEFKQYKIDHNLEEGKIHKYDYIVMQLKLCSEPVTNALYKGYEDALNQYLIKLVGKPFEDIVPNVLVEEDEKTPNETVN